MKNAAAGLAGLAVGWAMKTGGSDAWLAVVAAAMFGVLIAIIALGADLALRVYGRASK